MKRCDQAQSAAAWIRSYEPGRVLFAKSLAAKDHRACSGYCPRRRKHNARFKADIAISGRLSRRDAAANAAWKGSTASLIPPFPQEIAPSPILISTNVESVASAP